MRRRFYDLQRICSKEAVAEPSGRQLDFDRIPIERHWGLSMRLHDALGHTEPWEICEAGCDSLASEAIRILFDAQEKEVR